MGLIYLDSSVALRAILNCEERTNVQQWLDTPGETFVSSRLLKTEVLRVLRKDDRPLVEALPLLERVGLIDITREIHTLAESIERHVKTRDALHLGTALFIGERIKVATHDAGMKAAAQHLGLHVVDPVL